MKTFLRNNFGLAFGVLILTAFPVFAQQAFDGSTLLHEFTAPSKKTKGTGKSNAGGIPPLTADAKNDEPIFDEKGPNFSEEQKKPYGNLSPFGTTNRLDNKTDRVQTLNYFANFTPSIIPYKRAVAQNKIVNNKGVYEFQVQSQALQKVPILNASQEDSEIFWGSFLVRAERGQLHPLPSISPDQGILEIQTEPKVDVTLFRDGADNFSAKIDSNDLVRINIKFSVPSYYFNGGFADVVWTDFDASALSPLSSQIKEAAKKVGTQIGLSRSLSPTQNLTKMVEYFRNFEARPFPDELNKGDLYEQISINQIGVCRHRSLAFMITANSLGIPTRYVYNEAHAFVEVLWPDKGWRRVDLGGAADQLNAATNDGRELHKTSTDSLPQPDRFLKEQSRMKTDFGVENDAKLNEGEPRKEASHSEEVANENGEQESLGNPLVKGDENVKGKGKAVEEADLRSQPTLKILTAKSSVKRGMSITVVAKLSDEGGQALKGKKITAFLGPAGQKILANAVVIGTTKSNSAGRIKAKFRIPPDQDIGRWELFLYFRGDKEFGPALSD